jgi:hypothetical protein
MLDWDHAQRGREPGSTMPTNCSALFATTADEEFTNFALVAPLLRRLAAMEGKSADWLPS